MIGAQTNEQERTPAARHPWIHRTPRTAADARQPILHIAGWDVRLAVLNVLCQLDIGVIISARCSVKRRSVCSLPRWSGPSQSPPGVSVGKGLIVSRRSEAGPAIAVGIGVGTGEANGVGDMGTPSPAGAGCHIVTRRSTAGPFADGSSSVPWYESRFYLW